MGIHPSLMPVLFDSPGLRFLFQRKGFHRMERQRYVLLVGTEWRNRWNQWRAARSGNQFLWYDEKVGNFHLSLQVKQVPFAGNGGIQFRSERRQNGSAVGYQADIGKGWWGSLYHEHGRKILAKNKLKEDQYLKPEQWNSYEILAVGHRIWLAINGKITVAVRDPIGELDGQISLQIHGGIPQKIIYRKLRLTRNPKVEILGMKESELNALLALAPKGFVQPLNKSNK